ncbi:MAG: hypothetical protein KIT31_36815 [Deltaproteobacteria bacterium]|nr:hypothetical protein [Deltaproteobacteria bacterium]
MSEDLALDRPMVTALRASYEASRRHYRLAAVAMSALTVALAAICVATGSWTSLALVGVMFIPLWLFVGYRSMKFVGPDVVDDVLASPERVTLILKLVTPRTHVLGVELDDGRLVPLRFPDEASLEKARLYLAERSPKATISPPIDRGDGDGDRDGDD